MAISGSSIHLITEPSSRFETFTETVHNKHHTVFKVRTCQNARLLLSSSTATAGVAESYEVIFGENGRTYFQSKRLGNTVVSHSLINCLCVVT